MVLVAACQSGTAAGLSRSNTAQSSWHGRCTGDGMSSQIPAAERAASSSRAQLGAAAWSMANQVVDLLVHMTTAILVARWLGVQALGTFAFAFAAAGLLSVFMQFGSGPICIQLYGEGKLSAGTVLASNLRFVLWGSLVATVLLLPVPALFGLDWQAGMALALAHTALIANGFAGCLLNLLLARDASRLDAGPMLLSRVLLLGSVVLAVLSGSLLWTVGSYLLAALVLTLGRAALVIRRGWAPGLRHDPQVTRLIWRRARHLGVARMLGELGTRSDLLLLQWLSTTSAVAYFAACRRVLAGAQFAAAAACQSLFPALARGPLQGTPRSIRALYAGLPVVGSAVLLVVAGLGAGELTELLYGVAFAPAADTMRWLLLAAALQVPATFLAQNLVLRGAERVAPRAQAVGTLLNLALNVIAIPRWGAQGAAAATALSELARLGIYLGGSLFGPANDRVTTAASPAGKVHQCSTT